MAVHAIYYLLVSIFPSFSTHKHTNTAGGSAAGRLVSPTLGHTAHPPGNVMSADSPAAASHNPAR